MKTLAIIIGKIIILFGNILNRGSSLPGKVALMIDKNILAKLSLPKIKIAVTGSSGKGSTSKLIADILEDNNFTVSHNKEGSNLAWGVTSSILRDSTLTGKIKKDVLVLEIDERYLKEISKYIDFNYVVITNITKDQPPRQHTVDIVCNDILEGLKPNIKIITNIDDPYLRNFEKDTKNKFIYYGIAKNKYSFNHELFENTNTLCPYCHTKLNYEYYNFENLGNYNCPNCNFYKLAPHINGESLNLEEQTIVINNNIINIGGPLLYNAYNTLAAYTTIHALNIEKQNIVKSFNKFNQKKELAYINNDITFIPLSTKAENSPTYNQAIFKIIQDKRIKDIVIGWKEISRRYNHFDVSWLYDVEFELLNNSSLNKIYACGIDAKNIKRRLILAGINEKQIITAKNITDIKELIYKDKCEVVYGILNFDYVEPFIDVLGGKKYD